MRIDRRGLLISPTSNLQSYFGNACLRPQIYINILREFLNRNHFVITINI